MKKLYLLLLVLVTLFVSCKKDRDVEFSTFEVEDEKFIPSYTSTELSCKVRCAATIKELYLQYDTVADFSTYQEVELVENEKTEVYSVKIGDLLDNTTYYVRYLAVNSYSQVTSEEVSEFKTLQATTPTIEVREITDVLDTIATVGFVLKFDGGADITKIGVCWSVDSVPTIDSTHVVYSIDAEKGVADGDSLVMNISGLEANTKYYVRAYAENMKGVGYSKSKSFVTLTLPEVKTGDVSEIQYTSAVLHGEVIFNGNDTTIEYGFCWGEEADLTIEESQNVKVEVAEDSSFAYRLSNLQDETKYYVRAYAKNKIGLVFGEEKEFITLKVETLPTMTWEQNLSNFVESESNQIVSLTATSNKEGDIVYEIVSNEDNIISLNGNQLTIKGGVIGTADIKAYNIKYRDVYIIKNVIVASVKPCETEIDHGINLETEQSIIGQDKEVSCTLTLDKKCQSVSFTTDLTGDGMNGESYGIVTVSDDKRGEILNEIFYDGGLINKTCDIDPEATKITIKVKAVSVTGSLTPITATLTNVKTTLVSNFDNYTTDKKSIDFGTFTVGVSSVSKDLKINYWSLPGNINLSIESGNATRAESPFSIDKTTLTDNCGIGEKIVTIKINPIMGGTFEDYLVIKTGGDEVVKKIPLAITIITRTYTIAVYSHDNSSGTVSGGGTYAEGSQVTITATANSGYRFKEWNDGNTDNPRVITVTKDAIYTAHFEAEKNLNAGHEYVDLGLSVKWATCNVGATSPEDYGDYFAWGEVEPKEFYVWSNYKYSIGETQMLKYSPRIDHNTELDIDDDVAIVNWGDSWRIPTYEELMELRTNCVWRWINKNGIEGYCIIGKNGNSIFLPAAGYKYEDNLESEGWEGYYWASSLYISYPNSAYALYFDSDYVSWYKNHRCYGQSIRPVCK